VPGRRAHAGTGTRSGAIGPIRSRRGDLRSADSDLLGKNRTGQAAGRSGEGAVPTAGLTSARRLLLRLQKSRITRVSSPMQKAGADATLSTA
jgi:hypothetical protein